MNDDAFSYRGVLNKRTEVLKMTTKDQIRKFICEECLDDDEIGNDEVLFSSQLLDSMDLTSLIAYLEDMFDIKVSALDIVYENFDTIEKISSYVLQKQL